jgi:hypothetical protein
MQNDLNPLGNNVKLSGRGERAIIAFQLAPGDAMIELGMSDYSVSHIYSMVRKVSVR